MSLEYERSASAAVKPAAEMGTTVFDSTLYNKDASHVCDRGECSVTVAAQVRKLGGLFVIGTYLFDSDRVEAQLFGRAGRQVHCWQYIQ